MSEWRDLQRRGRGLFVLSSIRRPEGLKRFLESYRLVGERMNVDLHLWRDDPSRREYREIELPEQWLVREWPTEQWLPEAMNRSYLQENKARFYGLLSDDIELLTPYEQPLAELAGLGRVSYPDDGYWGERLCTHMVVGGDLCRAVGWFAYPEVKHSCIDNVWHTLADTLDVAEWCPGVKIKHWNPLCDDSVAFDSVNVRAKKHARADRQRFEEWARRDDGVMADLGKIFLQQYKTLGMWELRSAQPGA